MWQRAHALIQIRFCAVTCPVSIWCPSVAPTARPGGNSVPPTEHHAALFAAPQVIFPSTVFGLSLFNFLSSALPVFIPSSSSFLASTFSFRVASLHPARYYHHIDTDSRLFSSYFFAYVHNPHILLHPPEYLFSTLTFSLISWDLFSC